MKYKIIFLIAILFIVTGCSANYDLTFNKDGTITENVRVSSSDSKNYYSFDNYKEYIDTFLDYEYQPYNRKFLEDNNFNYSSFFENGNYGLLVDKTYKNINEYVKDSSAINQFFEELTVDRNGNIVTLQTKNYFGVLDTISYERYQIDEAEINLKIPWNVIQTNADNVDKKNNIYTWYISPNLKDVKVYVQYEENNFVKIINSTYTIIALLIVVLLVLLIFIIKFIKTSKKNNEI